MAYFPLDIRTELNLSGTWTNISPDVYVRDPKQITRGLRDMGSTADPASLNLTLNNKAGKYSRRNAMSPLFGLIGRNTPVRVSVPAAGDHYLHLDGDPAHYASTPDTAVLDITGDLDVRVELAPNWYGSESQIVIGKWDRPTLQQSWALHLYQGTLYFRQTTGGDEFTTGFIYFWPLPTLPDRAAVRVTFDADNGAGGRTVTAYWATSLDGPWTQFGNAQVVSGVGSIFSGTAPLTIGITDLRKPGTQPRFPLVGRAYRCEVRSGINGTIVAAPDFRSLADGTTSFTDSAGRPWTVSPGAEVRGREDRFVGEISSWPVEWSTDDADVWAPVQASGILRRMGQGQKPLASTLRRRIPSGKPLAYWPFEESQDASAAYSPINGVQAATVTGVNWASWDTLVSSAPLPSLKNGGLLWAMVPRSFSADQWQVEFIYNADGKIPPASGPFAPIISYRSWTGTVRRWDVLMKQGTCQVNGYDADGATIVNANIGIGADVFVGWTRLRFWAQDNGDGTFNWRINWQDVGGDAGGLTSTVTGKCGAVMSVNANWGPLTEGWGFGHLTVFPTAQNTTMDGSDNAYSGEDTLQRWNRLAAEEGLLLSRIAGEVPLQRVGYQRPDTILNILEAAAAADGGMMTEDPHRLGLRYRDRSSLYAQAPALTLSYKAPGLGADLQPVDDDSDVQNDVTVNRDSGSSARASLDSGPLSTQAPPQGVGLYDTSVTLSLADDDQPEPIANWLLSLGTFDGARYPQVTVQLHKPGADALIPAVLALREGDKIRLTDLPPWVSNDDVDLVVNGWSETLDLYQWEITFTCAPAGPWNVAVADSGVKADTDGSSVASAIGTGDTTMAVNTTAGPLWTSDPAETPFDIVVGGERMTVTTVGTVVNGNPFFETDTSGWFAQGGSIQRDTANLPPGKGAKGVLFIAPNGTTATGGAASTMSAPGSITPGAQYVASMWCRFAGGWSNVQPAVDWFDASGAYLSTSFTGSGFSVPVGTWTFLSQTFTAPANASRASMRAMHGGTPSQSTTWRAWGIRLIRVADYASSPQTFTVVRSVNRVVKAQAAGTPVNIATTPIVAL